MPATSNNGGVTKILIAIVALALIIGLVVILSQNSDRDQIRAVLTECTTVAGNETRPADMSTDAAAGIVVGHLHPDRFNVQVSGQAIMNRSAVAAMLPSLLGTLKRVEIGDLNIDVQGDWAFVEAKLRVHVTEDVNTLFDTGDRGYGVTIQCEAIKVGDNQWQLGKMHVALNPTSIPQKSTLFPDHYEPE